MPDLTYAQKLELAGRVTAPALRQVIGALALSPGSRGLDAGCGTGQHAPWLAAAVGPTGSVVGLDVSADNLNAANHAEPRRQCCFVQGDLLRLPFAERAFDWLWCADTFWPAAVLSDPVAALKDLSRVVRPGGSIALAYWSSQMLLPGYPGLEARLNAAFTTAVPYLGEVPPQHHFLRASGWLRAAGLRALQPRTFLAELQAPLAPNLRAGLAYCLEMLWGQLRGRISGSDWEEYHRLCDAESESFIGDLSDYYGFVGYTLFRGVVRV
ncbi:MAG: methyltransferase domain-containing protein [Chloroflexi bacterium]|nr:methyltransferase domain-containing protein [Chloroflexota bacterium]